MQCSKGVVPLGVALEVAAEKCLTLLQCRLQEDLQEERGPANGSFLTEKQKMRPNVNLAAYSALFTLFGCTCTIIGGLGVHGVSRGCKSASAERLNLSRRSGPTVGKLAENLGKNPEDLGVIYIFGSGAELLGGIASGWAYDWAPNSNYVIGGGGALLGSLFALIPVASFFNRIALTVIFTLACFPRPFINTGGNLMVVWMLGKKSAPWLNAINGMFGLGATLAPFVSDGVWAATKWMDPLGYHRYRVACAFWLVAILVAIACAIPMLLEAPTSETHRHLENEARRKRNRERRRRRREEESLLKSDEEGAATETEESEGQAGTEQEEDEEDEEPEPDIRVRWVEPILLLGVLFMTAATAIEVSMGNWVYTYALHYMHLKPEGASTLNSFYWLAFTGARLVLLPVLFSSTALTPAACLLGSTLLVIFGCLTSMHYSSSVVALYFCAAAAGIGVAPCYGTTVALVREHIPLSGRSQSSFAIATGLGAGLGPFGAAAVMSGNNYGRFIPFELACAFISLASSVAMAAWPKRPEVVEWERRRKRWLAYEAEAFLDVQPPPAPKLVHKVLQVHSIPQMNPTS